MPRTVLALGVTALLATPAAAAADCPGRDVAPGREADLPAFERTVLCLIDAERVERGRRPLTPDPRLARAAGRHAADMVQRAYFAHVTPAGTSPLERLRRAGWRGTSYGEVLAWGTSSRARPDRLVRSWMRSPGHRTVLLDPRLEAVGAGGADGTPRSRRDAGVTVAVDLGA